MEGPMEGRIRDSVLKAQPMGDLVVKALPMGDIV